MREWRRRRAAGVVRLALELRPDAVEDLVALGWLRLEERRDPSAVNAAFCAFVGEALDRRVTRAA